MVMLKDDHLKLCNIVNEDNPVLLRNEKQVYDVWPSNGSEAVKEQINFTNYLVPRPGDILVMRVKGDSMKDANIPHGALIIADKTIRPSNNMIVVAKLNGEFTVKRFIQNSSGIRLMPANEKYTPVPITEDMDCTIWGTVTQIIVNALEV